MRLHSPVIPGSRRGAALLIVLAVLMITMTATALLVSRAADVRLQTRFARYQRVADDLLCATEAPIQHWLESKSASIVLSPDASLPASPVLCDRWQLRGPEDTYDVQLTITAFDQYGMVPLQVARSGSPLRLTLSWEILQRVDAATLPSGSDPTPHFGLDLFMQPHERDDKTHVEIFPNVDGIPRTFGDQVIDEHNAISPTGASSVLAVGMGGRVATHNRDPIRININTAPMPLVEAALRVAGRSGLAQIRVARTEGKLAPAGDPIAVGAGEHEADALIPQIVSTSDRWSFRIDIRVGAVHRSWWAIYGPGPDRPATPLRESWMCLQRLCITE